MSKPGKVLKRLCKKLGVRLTIKRGKKRVYKSVKVLKAQCKRKAGKKKKRKKVKRKRKFGAHIVSRGYNFPERVENRIASFLGPEPQEVVRQRRRLIDVLNLARYAKIATDDGTTPTNITGFTEVPPAGLKLYVHFRGKVNDGNKHKFTNYTLGHYPKKIEGTIHPLPVGYYGGHKVWNNEHWFDNDDKRRYMLFIRITDSEDPADIDDVVTIRGDRDIVSLLPFTNSGDFGKKKRKKVKKKSKRRK